MQSTRSQLTLNSLSSSWITFVHYKRDPNLNHIGSVVFMLVCDSSIRVMWSFSSWKTWLRVERTRRKPLKVTRTHNTPKPICDLAPTGAASSIGKPFQIVLRSNGNPWDQNMEISEINQYNRIMRFWDHFPPPWDMHRVLLKFHPEKGVRCFYLCCCSKQPWKQTPLHSSINHKNTQLDPYMYKCAFFYPYSNRHKRAAEEKVMTWHPIQSA